MECSPVLIRGKQLSFVLIARRNRFRVGPRYMSRGIDETGAVSNFVETEQLLHVHSTGDVTSVVQLRGSMPFFWRQVVNVRYQPERLIDSHLPSVSHLKFLICAKGKGIRDTHVSTHFLLWKHHHR